MWKQTFEHQYLVRNPGMEEGAALWWMRPKENFRDPHEKNSAAISVSAAGASDVTESDFDFR